MLNSVQTSPSFEAPVTHYFLPEDLAIMRHAYHTACQARPMAVRTEAQRLILAKAIVVVYNSVLSEAALVTAAFDLMT